MANKSANSSSPKHFNIKVVAQHLKDIRFLKIPESGIKWPVIVLTLAFKIWKMC